MKCSINNFELPYNGRIRRNKNKNYERYNIAANRIFLELIHLKIYMGAQGALTQYFNFQA